MIEFLQLIIDEVQRVPQRGAMGLGTGRLEIACYAAAGEVEALALTPLLDIAAVVPVSRFAPAAIFHLRLDSFAFPASGHHDFPP